MESDSSRLPKAYQKCVAKINLLDFAIQAVVGPASGAAAPTQHQIASEGTAGCLMSPVAAVVRNERNFALETSYPGNV